MAWAMCVFPVPGGPDDEHVAALIEKLTRGQLEDLLARKRRVEVPFKVIEGLEIEEAGVLGPPFELPLVSDSELVLEDQLQEFDVAEPTGLCLLEPDLERLGQPREPQLPEDRAEMITHGKEAPGMKQHDVTMTVR
jgi:hypothetical protein